MPISTIPASISQGREVRCCSFLFDGIGINMLWILLPRCILQIQLSSSFLGNKPPMSTESYSSQVWQWTHAENAPVIAAFLSQLCSMHYLVDSLHVLVWHALNNVHARVVMQLALVILC